MSNTYWELSIGNNSAGLAKFLDMVDRLNKHVSGTIDRSNLADAVKTWNGRKSRSGLKMIYETLPGDDTPNSSGHVRLGDDVAARTHIEAHKAEWEEEIV
jgi:hypothetical protein